MPSPPIIGLQQAGNTNLYTRPILKNPDGSTSTVNSMSFGQGGREILVPGMSSQRLLSRDESIKQYYQTGQHLGMFDTPNNATTYAKQLHENYAAHKFDVPLATSRKSVNPAQLSTVLQGLLKSGPYIDPYQVK